MNRLEFVRLLLLMFLLVWRAAGAPASFPPARPIDRQGVVSRHNVKLTQVNPRMVLQVGNGDFAFSADVTGLQTFGGYTLSNWGWHEEPLPVGLTPADRQRTEFTSHGRKRYYLAPHRQPELAQWLNDNPHRAHAAQQPVGDIVTALLEAGFTLEALREWPYANGCRLNPSLVAEGEDGWAARRFVPPTGVPSIPLMVGLSARKTRGGRG